LQGLQSALEDALESLHFDRGHGRETLLHAQLLVRP
jgi:hypothetical protein